MTKLNLLGGTAIRAIAFAGATLAFCQPAFAQEAPAATEQSATDQSETLKGEVEIQSGTDAAPESAADTIVVTGSRIKRPNLESTIPITSIGGESLFRQGDTNIGDTLNELPQLRSTFAQSNPGLGIGVAGLNLLDLRGLGTVRTLVLVNGRRHVASDILNNAVSPDVNTIPNDLIERVDIVTGGNSAIYGSDAIAGVVNFILRRDFDGLQVRGQAGVAAEGFGGNQYVSAMYGKNFADGRANITVHGEYANQKRIFGSDIPWLEQLDGLVVTDVDGAGLVNGSDGVPDRTFVRDIRSASINRFGLIPITQDSSATNLNPACGRGIAAGAPLTGLAYNCTFVFGPDGTMVPQTGGRYGAGIIGGIAGGNGQTGREDEILSVIPKMQRYNFNLLGHFTISDALEPFIEAKWVRVDSIGSNAGPSFIQGQQVQFDARERIRLDNPFLTPAQRTTIANAILASGCNTSLTATCTSTPAAGVASNRLTAAQIAQIAAGTYRFVDARQLVDSGIRDEKFQRDTYRFVGGLRGNFNDDWNYEISANYGKFKEKTTTFGYLDRQRFMLSLDSGRNPITGQIQCRAQFDPASATTFPADPANTARLANDIAACIPYNPFGGSDNSAAANYFTYNARHKASLSQFVLSGFVAGDSSQLFELPGGPIEFALGAEYRKEKAHYQQDPFVEGGFTNAVVIPTFAPPAFEVKEAFGEIRIPIVKDIPVFHELTVSGAARVADYKGATGTVWAYNFGGDWAPIRDIRFRANYSRAVRAPNVSETGFPLVPNFAPGFADPCNANNIANNANRAANCLADLGAALLAGLPNNTYSLPIVSGSNPDLTAEISESYTLGAVVQPRYIPGLSISVDYYKIKVKDVIVSLSAQQIANNCYDQPSLGNIFCSLFTRYRGTTTGFLGTEPGQILANSLVSAGVNFASRVRRGIDVNAAYRAALGWDVRLNTNLIYTHNLQISNFENPAIPTFENRILGELGDPKNEFRWDVDLSKGPFTIGYKMRYIGEMWTGAFEDFNELQGRPPQNEDFADIRKYPAVFYHDVRVEWDIKNGVGGFGKDLNIYLGVDNLLDTHPPLGLAGTGTGGATDRGTGNAAIYDVRGRNFYAGFKARF